ncbi:MAG TPA: SAM-dependent methyltransferase [Magnetospirillaceae bacterium]
MAVSEFMDMALAHPEHGYYRKKDPLGRGGDFITAPEISQMFGELTGLWASVVWHSMGAPDPVLLVELGPGRGTLMADLLRSAAMDPAFREAIRIHLVETSPTLRARQAEALKTAEVEWHDYFAAVPSGPMIVIANEFFDALPVHQFVHRAGQWHERVVTAAGDDLVFGDGAPVAIVGPATEDGAVFERNEAAAAIAGLIGERLAVDKGAALIIDYGHATSALGDTLQAVKGHARTDVLAEPGEADLTAHVDFQALASAARPAQAWGPITQGVFLRALGIELRTDRLMRANPKQATAVETACRRLIDSAEMGTLFKALALTHPSLATPPGFER